MKADLDVTSIIKDRPVSEYSSYKDYEESKGYNKIVPINSVLTQISVSSTTPKMGKVLPANFMNTDPFDSFTPRVQEVEDLDEDSFK